MPGCLLTLQPFEGDIARTLLSGTSFPTSGFCYQWSKWRWQGCSHQGAAAYSAQASFCCQCNIQVDFFKQSFPRLLFCLFDHMQACTQSSLHSCIRSFSQSVSQSFMQSFMQSFVLRSFIHSFTHSIFHSKRMLDRFITPSLAPANSLKQGRERSILFGVMSGASVSPGSLRSCKCKFMLAWPCIMHHEVLGSVQANEAKGSGWCRLHLCIKGAV